MKPRHIANKLQLSADYVHKLVHYYKQRVKKISQLQPSDGSAFNEEVLKVSVEQPKRNFRKSRVHDEQLLQLLAEYIRTHGVHSLRIADIRRHLSNLAIEGFKVPCPETISLVLKEKFHLRFGKYNGSIVRYRDPQYLDRRLWIVRIITQLLKDDVLIVSIDETHFRSDLSPQRSWQLKNLRQLQQQKMRMKLKRVKHTRHQIPTDGDALSFGLRLLEVDGIHSECDAASGVENSSDFKSEEQNFSSQSALTQNHQLHLQTAPQASQPTLQKFSGNLGRSRMVAPTKDADAFHTSPPRVLKQQMVSCTLIDRSLRSVMQISIRHCRRVISRMTMLKLQKQPPFADATHLRSCSHCSDTSHS